MTSWQVHQQWQWDMAHMRIRPFQVWYVDYLHPEDGYIEFMKILKEMNND